MKIILIWLLLCKRGLNNNDLGFLLVEQIYRINFYDETERIVLWNTKHSSWIVCIICKGGIGVGGGGVQRNDIGTRLYYLS